MSNKGNLVSGYVGIWYLHKNKIHANIQTLDSGCNDGLYIHCADTLKTLTKWREFLITDNPTAYGSVIYNIRTICYEIVCSKSFPKDMELIKQIVSKFNLNTCQYDVIFTQDE